MTLSLPEFLQSCIREKLFPGCSLGIFGDGKCEVLSAGNFTYDPASHAVTADTIYDVASITKAIPTACLALKLIEEGAMEPSSRLIEFVPEFSGTFRDQIRIRHLLTHTLDFEFKLSEKKDLSPSEIIRAILSARLRTPPGAVYSYANATSILLGIAVERVCGLRLDAAARQRFFDPLGMRSTTFFPESACERIAPSEDDPWRGRVIRGEVHDESAWALRPLVVAGSAGLFSTAPDLLRFLQMLLQGGRYDGARYFTPETVRLMHTDALARDSGNSTAFGWELCQERFMGTCRGRSTFGKTGFTGCAIVADHARGAGFVFLTNHTFPVRRESKATIDAVRAKLADFVLEKSIGIEYNVRTARSLL